VSGADTLLAHGLGGRSDLPLPPGYAVAGAALAVIASFVVLGLLWRKPKLSADAGRPLPRGVSRVLDSNALRLVAQSAALLLSVAVLAVAFFGPADTGTNLAPWALYITFWCGLVPLSVLFGPVWKVANPLRLLHRGLSRVLPGSPRPLPAGLGYWPAALWLAGFVWLELVAPGRGDPRTVGALIVAYGVVNLAAAQVYGRAWFARGDGFEVYSTLFGRLSPLGRRARDGAPVVRNPLSGLVGIRPEPGLVAVAVVLVGATAFDGLTRTRAWSGSVDPNSLSAGTLGLAGAIGFVATIYVLALRATAELAAGDRRAMPGIFAPTLVPIALGYTVAHYFSFFLLEGQVTYILASDPFRTGADLFGTAGNRIDYTLVGPTLVAVVQVSAIVVGHVLGTVAAHDKAVALFRPAVERRAQLPVLAVMVVLTCTGVGLLFSG
jgi:hypothetical protein